MEKTALRIRKFGDPVLRKKAGLVKKITPDHRDILSGMARLMYDGEGIGLAASQVGLGQAMIVVDKGKGLYKIVNPKVVKALGTQVNLEGCLSVP
ncbi:MAG: peptide deformylase, partial [Candidatus Omnitrophica bacterium]|nr:peptide deformylase [Candidatus Omnitrophota bacterium]